jgi:hypothetical protein
MSNRLGDHYNRYSKTQFSEYNGREFDQNDYKNVYSDSSNTQRSVKNESDITYEEYTHFITISSRDRNRSVFSNVNHYNITLPQEFRNIYYVELVQAIIPAKNNSDAEPYLLLDIDELSDVMISNDKHISNSFAILQPTVPTTTGGFMQIDKRIHENTIKIYKTPKASLSKLTVSIRDCLGNLFNFGSDTTLPTTVDKSLQNTFVFKIVTLEKRRSELNQRNVF